MPRAAFKPKPTPQQRQPPASPQTTAQLKPLTFKPRSHDTFSAAHPPPSSARISRARKPVLIALGTLALGISFYTVYTYQTYKREADRLRATPPPSDTSFRYNSCAETFDDSVAASEWLSGISKLRAKLLSQARGHVLEASVGTGRNASYYPLTKGIKSVTMVDQSSEMIRVARMNWAKTNAYFINAIFRIQSAADAVPFPAAVNAEAEKSGVQPGFDTVVQTMGVCSTGDPVGVLRNLGRMCKPSGKILLLEHGLGKYKLINRVLDEIAPAHAERWGCWFNKDVGAIVRESGLEIVEERRYQFGTVWWFVLKPPKDRSVLEAPERTEESVLRQVTESRPWWYAWWQ